MLKLLCIAAARFHLRHPGQLLLALAGISLGVAAFIGIQSANRAAERAFQISSESFRGRSTHRVIGVGRDLPTSVYQRLALNGFGSQAAPVISAEARLVVDGAPGPRIDIMGVDPIEEITFGRFFPLTKDASDTLLRLVAEPRALLATPDALFGRTPATGEPVLVELNGQRIEFRFIGELGVAGSAPAAVPLLLVDIATLEPITGSDRLSRIDLSLAPNEVASVESLLPNGTTLVASGNRNAELEGMTHAFTTNLSALGLLALVVGLFLIHATMSFSVVRRRTQIATLRGLGLSKPRLVASIALEAAAIGTIAGLAGAALGQALASVLIDLVLRTMSDLAFSRAVANEVASWWTYPAGIFIGVVTTLVAAILPAREAAALSPAVAERRSDLERRSRHLSRRFAQWSLLLVVTAIAILAVWPQNIVVGFLGLFLVLIAGAMCVPIATSQLMTWLEQPARFVAGLPAVMAVRSVTASLSRTGVATAALTVAVATVVSIGLMVESFRGSLVDWIDDTLTADIYVLIDSTGPSESGTGAWADAIARIPGVTGVSRIRRAIVPAESGDVGLRASEPGPEGWGLDLVAGFDTNWSDELAAGEGIVISEPYAYRHGLETGDELSLPTASGTEDFRIVGVARDYNTAGPAISIGLGRYREAWRDTALSGLGVHLAPNSEQSVVAGAIRQSRPPGIDSVTRTTDNIRRVSLGLFDRTFEVTAVLRGLAGVVAFLGVLSAILALQLERRHEFSILRSIGMTLGQLRMHVIAHTALLGLAAALSALPIGCVLAWLLVFVINRRAFGWTMNFDLAAGPLAYGFAIAIAAASLSGLVAAFLSMRANTPVGESAN